ncbi:Rnf-Nqr domain containing protein [Pseudomonas sp. NPDC089734]|uniref:Rnf-Nqr domain containing protein n=1 Tax=Pseudomonas sp. NPDC089734 TaxID=3364469 RepID=UPI003804431A
MLRTPSPVLAGTLSLVPLIGVTDSLIKALAFLLIFGALGTLHHRLLKGLTPLLNTGQTWIASALIAATLVTCADTGLQFQFPELHQALGIYLPLIALHCMQTHTTRIGKRTLGGYAALMLIMGLIRELAGQATILSDAHWLFGNQAAEWQISLSYLPQTLHMATLAPGGFILLGLLLAAYNALNRPTPPKDTPSS